MRTLDSYTPEEINELDNLMLKPEEERTEEEKAKIDEFNDATQIATMVEQARAQEIAKAANDRVLASIDMMNAAIAEQGAMYSAAIARLEEVNSNNG